MRRERWVGQQAEEPKGRLERATPVSGLKIIPF